jgi:ubiquinone/menaquinone biosynthesis C-methylase UbiE
MDDKKTEERRYNHRAIFFLDNKNFKSVNSLSRALKSPYNFYQKSILRLVDSDDFILEIGAGMGENTDFLLDTGAKVCATDISKQSLSVIRRRFCTDKLTTKVADMERLPFNNKTFDVVCCSGSLSYGEHTSVMNEVHRVLKKDGVLIVVDSLNDSLIYRFNRYIHYLKGRRSLSVIKRTPDLRLLKKYEYRFNNVETYFFGSISYLIPIMNKIFGEKRAERISDFVDKFFLIKKSAFKFVLIAEK